MMMGRERIHVLAEGTFITKVYRSFKGVTIQVRPSGMESRFREGNGVYSEEWNL
jgi:hypothetical protein